MSDSLSRMIFLGTIFLSATFAQADDTDLERMLKSIENRMGDDAARQRAIEDGEERAVLCQYCHGSDGNSLKPDVPNLAGQNAKYLLDQIDKFASGQRDDYVMNQLAANFSPEDKVNVAIFYYSQPVKPQAVDAGKALEGEALYQSVCRNCHGIEGRGNHRLARLAGQKVNYVTKVLQDFRANANNPAARNNAHRKSEIMEGVAKSLSDEQIAAVAAYVGQLP